MVPFCIITNTFHYYFHLSSTFLFNFPIQGKPSAQTDIEKVPLTSESVMPGN